MIILLDNNCNIYFESTQLDATDDKASRCLWLNQCNIDFSANIVGKYTLESAVKISPWQNV